MPDAQVLYVVTAAVVLGLIAWVIVVLSRAPKVEGAALQRQGATEGGVAATIPDQPAVSNDGPRSVRPSALDPHDEIQDGSELAGHGPEVRVDIEEEEEPTGPHALILVTAVGRTDPGLKRKHNEDAYTILENHHLFVIADGMGRHAAGEVASQLCVEAIGEAFNSGKFGKTPFDHALPKRGNRIRGAILEANDRILATAQENEAYAGMGTTVVAAYFSPNNQRVYIAHVGDSRCYRLRDEKLSQLTTDHTLGAAGITGKSAAVLSRAVGVEENVEVDVAMESPLPSDIYLLCSDGLSRMVNDEEIQSTVSTMAKDLDGATKKLIEMANERGGRDNITAILVRVDDAKHISEAPKAKA
jgi:protein phosphatase